MSSTRAAGVDLLYEGLARYHWLRRSLRRPPAGEVQMLLSDKPHSRHRMAPALQGAIASVLSHSKS